MIFFRGILKWCINISLVLVYYGVILGHTIGIQNTNRSVDIAERTANLEFLSREKRQDKKVPFRRPEDKILVIYCCAIMVHIPRFDSCDQFKMLAWYRYKGRLIKNPYPSRCVQYGDHIFHLFNFGQNHHYIARLYRKGKSVSSVRIMFKTPRMHRNAPPVEFHVVGSYGPGWIDLRFGNQRTPFPQMYTFLVKYRRQGFTTMNDVEDGTYHHVLPNERPTFNRVEEWTVLPLYPCPEWIKQGMYCLVLSDFVRPNKLGARKYVDYVFMIYTVRMWPSQFTKGAPCWEYQDRRQSRPYKAVVRVWDDCDPAGKIGRPCPKLLTPLNENPEIVGSQKELAEQQTNETDRPGSITEPYDADQKAIETLRQLWPLFLFLLLLLLFVVIPLVFVITQERAMREVMSNWYCWTTPDGKKHFIIALPPGIPPGDLIPDDLKQNS